jgi:hypothetical protein
MPPGTKSSPCRRLSASACRDAACHEELILPLPTTTITSITWEIGSGFMKKPLVLDCFLSFLSLFIEGASEG